MRAINELKEELCKLEAGYSLLEQLFLEVGAYNKPPGLSDFTWDKIKDLFDFDDSE